MPEPNIAIIGGGAAGYFAAITAAEANPAAQITLYEQSKRTLQKVKISGGGRCNVTHSCFDPKDLATRYPRGARELRAAFHRWQPQDTIDWFAARGVPLKTEPDGRMFPTTDDSQTIIDCFQQAARDAGVQLRKECGVKRISHQMSFIIDLSDGTQVSADKVCIAVGSLKASPLTHALEALGHQIEPLAPSLFAFNLADKRTHGLAGLSVQNATVSLLPSGGAASLAATGGAASLAATGGAASLAASGGAASLPASGGAASLPASAAAAPRLTLGKPEVAPPKSRKPRPQTACPGVSKSSRGPILITHRGLSGPAILRLSAWEARALQAANYHFEIEVSWLGDVSENQIREQFNRLRKGKTQVKTKVFDQLPRRLWERLVETAGIGDDMKWAQLPKDKETALIRELTEGRYSVQGKTTNKDEFVTCGGVRLKEVDFKTMESKLVPGLHFAGECLDIDGITGGFNFQAAWTTGRIAGLAMAEE